jgi:hypothetical protein
VPATAELAIEMVSLAAVMSCSGWWIIFEEFEIASRKLVFSTQYVYEVEG